MKLEIYEIDYKESFIDFLLKDTNQPRNITQILFKVKL